MTIRNAIGEALDPKATWNTIDCVCGYTVRVPSALGGREGTCPQCFRLIVTPGERTECPRSGGIFTSHHPDREIKRLWQEPNFADRDSSYAAAQRHSIVPGAVYLLVMITICGVLMRSPSAEPTLGLTDAPPWLLPTWFLTLWLLMSTCMATSALAFQQVADKTYSQEIIAFAAAGGFDIGRWIPLSCFIILYGFYASTLNLLPAYPLAIVRNPWSFLLLGSALGQIATWIVARRVFACRFTTRH